MVVRFPCKICNKTVSYGSDSIQCDKCDIWVHRQCNGLNKQTFEYLKKDKSEWFCMVCTKDFLPLSNLDDKNIITFKGKKMKFTNVAEKRVSNTSRFGYAIQVLPSDRTIISKHQFNQKIIKTF